MICMGTRPEAVKLAPLIDKLSLDFEVVVVSTGQHDELLYQVLDFFKITPNYDLRCMPESPNLEKLQTNIIEGMDEVFSSEKPDLLLVQGDTMTVYQTAFMATLRKIPLFHLEAGLRSGCKHSPFPEELLRTMVGKMADFHFAPTQRARNNLLLEGIPEDRIFVTGNSVVDALLMADKNINADRVYEELSNLDFPLDKLSDRRKNILITAHRSENIGSPMKNICRAVVALSRNYFECNFIWLLHKNPRVRDIVLSETDDKPDNFILTEAVGYETLVYLMKKSHIIMTDSGGIQEEAPTFGVPVIVLRDSTERPELVENGNGLVIGKDVPEDKIIAYMTRLLNDHDYYNSFARAGNPFGDGKTSERIATLLRSPEIKKFLNDYPESAEMIISAKQIGAFEFSQDIRTGTKVYNI